MKSFLSYLGGKSLLASKIIPKIPHHKCYCEVFSGAAWLLFAKEESEVEIINDINTDLITLYRVIQNHLEEFIRYFKWILTARGEFERFKKENPDTLTDIQRAVRFYYLLKNSYASKITSPSFNIATTTRPKLNLLRIEEDLSAAHLRLSRVYIENLHFEKILTRFDRPHTFFYIDPPYFGCEKDYGKNIFFREDFKKLRDVLKEIQGKFIMSCNDVPEIRLLFENFRIETIDTIYNIGGAEKKTITEILVMNFKPEKRKPQQIGINFY